MFALRARSSSLTYSPIRCSCLPRSFRNRLLSSLAVLEQRGGELQYSSLSAVTAAQAIGGPLIGFVAGKAAKKVAEQAAKIKGLSKVIVVENDAYERVKHTRSSASEENELRACRVFLKITDLFSWRISRSKAALMSSRAILPLARA